MIAEHTVGCEVKIGAVVVGSEARDLPPVDIGWIDDFQRGRAEDVQVFRFQLNRAQGSPRERKTADVGCERHGDDLRGGQRVGWHAQSEPRAVRSEQHTASAVE